MAFRPETARCTNCREIYTRTQESQRFCTSKCRWAYHRDGKTPQARIDKMVERALKAHSVISDHEERIKMLELIAGTKRVVD
jgi:hypothetical protein